MFWKIHWQCVEVDCDGFRGNLLPDVYECRCDTWEHAMGAFIAHINAEQVVRVWWTVHKDENDKGSVMCGYTSQWGEGVTLVRDTDPETF
jgi:hypothetical protein